MSENIQSSQSTGNGNGNGQKELFTKAIFPGRLVLLGCGSIGQGIIPLLMRHTDITPERMQIVTANEIGKKIADGHHIPFRIETLTAENYPAVLASLLKSGDFLLNLTVDVHSLDLVTWCQEHNVLYVDTSREVWPGTVTNAKLSVAERTYYALREHSFTVRAKYAQGPTAVLAHGANPGLVSHFVKAALLNIARDTRVITQTPHSREEWAALMQTLNIKVIQVAEHDTQASTRIKERDEFVNTWSIEGFIVEALMPAEVGWGSHEKEFPAEGHEHVLGSKAAIYLDRPGALTMVRSWTPREGSSHAFLIPHEESISIADYFSVREGETIAFRPTVFYAYHPCDDAVLSVREYAGNDWKAPVKKRILLDEIERGSDELGVLLMGHKKRSYWYGSDLSIAQTREAVSHLNATGLQVTAGALSAVIWALENPKRGIVEPEDLDFERVLEIAAPFLGTMHGKYTSWTPLRDRSKDLFPEDIAASPWQFKNFRV